MKKNIERFLYFLVYSNIYLALGALSIAYMSIVLLQVPFRWEPLFIAFSGTFFLYNLNRKTDIGEDRINYPERVEFFEKYGSIIFKVSIIFFVSSLLLALLNGIITFLVVLTPFVLVILYSVLRLKKIFLIKNIFVGMGWATIPLLAGLYSHPNYIITLIVVMLFIFLRVWMGTAIFDVKDIVGDRIYKISTIPGRYGIKTLKLFSYLLNTSAGILILYCSFIKILPIEGFLVFLITFYSYFTIFLIGKSDIKFVSNILVNGDGWIMGLLALFGKIWL